MTNPSETVIDFVLRTEGAVLGLAVAAVMEGIPCRKDLEPLSEAIQVHRLKVQGNRSGQHTITWSDLRLAFAGTLRLCLAHLEGENG